VNRRSESQPSGQRLIVGALIALQVAAAIAYAQTSPAQTQPQETPAQEITFPSGSVTLHGFLFKPAGDGPFPAVLWNHGSERLPGRLQPLADFFVGKGYAFFVPHRRGQGRSSDAAPYVMDLLRTEGQVRGPSARSAKLVEMMQLHFQDQLAGLAYLSSLAFVDAKRIAVMGCSFGGIQTLLAAENAPDVRAAVDFAGGAESWEGSPDLRARMIKAARNAKVPVFFIQAEGDYDLAPSRTLAKEMEKQGKPAQIRIYPSVGHTQQENHSFCVHGVDAWGADALAFVEKSFAGGQSSTVH
jgi:carboxymethylenebutenolidase